MSREIVRFPANQPVTVALEYVALESAGVACRGLNGPQVRYFLTGNRMMYVDADAAHVIDALHLDVGVPFVLTRRTEPGKTPWWDVARVQVAAASQTPAPEPKSESRPVSAPGPTVLPGDVKKIPPHATTVPAGGSTPHPSGLHVPKTPPLRPTYEAAFRECLRIVTTGLEAAGEHWSDHSVQAMTSTLFIQAARDGRLQFQAPAERVA